jgi:hypothetical protein
LWYELDTIRKTNGDLALQIKQGLLSLDPDHQRNVTHDNQWKSQILHSQIYERDIPDVYFHPCENEDGSRRYDSLDGKQRCSAIVDYIENKYSYTSKEPKTMENRYFKDLPVQWQGYLKDELDIGLRSSKSEFSKRN